MLLPMERAQRWVIPSRPCGEAARLLADLERGRSDVACVSPKAWSHLPRRLILNATSAWLNSQQWLRGEVTTSPLSLQHWVHPHS